MRRDGFPQARHDTRSSATSRRLASKWMAALWVAAMIPAFAGLTPALAPALTNGLSGGLQQPVSRSPSNPSIQAVCEVGWSVVSEIDNSFQWADASGAKASWDGGVQVHENRDAECYVYELRIVFTGPLAGGIVNLTGYQIGMSFSIQYPTPYVLWVDVPINAYGNANSWRPGGWQGHLDNFVVFYAHIHEDINARGAEEYYIGTDHVADNVGMTGIASDVVVTGVEVVFAMPLSLLGQTVHIQMHVWHNRYNFVTPLYIPGAAPPALP